MLGSLAHAVEGSRKSVGTYLLRWSRSLTMIIIRLSKLYGESLAARQVDELMHEKGELVDILAKERIRSYE